MTRRPDGEGWTKIPGGWRRPCTSEELAKLAVQRAEYAKTHRTEWVEKCDDCGEHRGVAECLICRENCVVCDSRGDHRSERPDYCTGGGCAADDAKGGTKKERQAVQHCNDCCSCTEDGEPAPPTHAELEAAGQIPLPEVTK